MLYFLVFLKKNQKIYSISKSTGFFQNAFTKIYPKSELCQNPHRLLGMPVE